MKHRARVGAFAVAASLAVLTAPLRAQTPARPIEKPTPSTGEWTFAASGDSRNCGDVVMPAIAASVKGNGVSFYWHLGDFRRIAGVDEDIEHQPEHLAEPLSMPEYERLAWNDFITGQLEPFGSISVYLSRGNHETIAPKTRAEYVSQFRAWLDAPNLREQRLRDNPSALDPETYYHWIQNGVDFITLDNSTGNEFDPAQIVWFEKVLRDDSSQPAIHAIVVGMHEALPESISRDHSMNESEHGTASGRRAYADLLGAQNGGKHVYVLASHSHYFMDGIFQTEYWREHGGILPGWIVGTAGAQRYALPADSRQANAAQTNVYGYLLGTVSASSEIRFHFERLNEQDLPSTVTTRYGPAFVHWCFVANSRAR